MLLLRCIHNLAKLLLFSTVLFTHAFSGPTHDLNYDTSKPYKVHMKQGSTHSVELLLIDHPYTSRFLAMRCHEPFSHQLIGDAVLNLKGQYVIDGGAYVGDTTLFIAKLLKKKMSRAKVIAVDPDQSNIDFINQMAKHNGLDNIITVVGAIGDKSRDIIIHDKAPNPGAKQVTERPASHNDSKDVVKMFTIDQILSMLNVSYSDVGFIHLDVEGWEINALTGSPQLLKNYNADLMLELNPTPSSQNSRTGDRIDEAVALLQRYGYHLSHYLPQKGEDTNSYFSKSVHTPNLSPFAIYLRSFEYSKIVRIVRSWQRKYRMYYCAMPYV
jgi:FkbM family methyltransferase